MAQLTRFRKPRPNQAAVLVLTSLIALALVLICSASRKSNAQDGPPKYSDISKVPLDKRKSAFSAASPEQKSEAFRTRLALYLAGHPQLNETQKRIVLQGISLASPELYEVRPDSPDWKSKVDEPVKQFQASVVSGFSGDEAARIFAAMVSLDAQDELFNKYRELVALAMAERRGAFKGASPQDKSDFWRVHLALYIAKHAELTDAQKIIILEGMSLAAPELFAVPFGGADWKIKVTDAISRFQNHILGVFSKQEAGKVFATLGDPQYPSEPRVNIPPPALSVAPPRNDSQAMFLLTRFVANNTPNPDCSCNKSQSFCGWNYYCGNDTCTTTQYGCGYFWLDQCNGNCLERRED